MMPITVYSILDCFSDSKVKRNLKTKLDEAFIKTTTNGLSKQVKEEKDSLEVNIQTLKNDTVKKINDSKR